MRKCEACGTMPAKEYSSIRTTNGVLHLCRQCLDDLNRKNPEIARPSACCEKENRCRTGRATTETEDVTTPTPGKRYLDRSTNLFVIVDRVHNMTVWLVEEDTKQMFVCDVFDFTHWGRFEER